jgi:hypothetical protein
MDIELTTFDLVTLIGVLEYRLAIFQPLPHRGLSQESTVVS